GAPAAHAPPRVRRPGDPAADPFLAVAHDGAELALLLPGRGVGAGRAHAGQVGGDAVEFAARDGRVGGLAALGQFLEGEPSLDRGDPQPLDDGLPLGVGGPHGLGPPHRVRLPQGDRPRRLGGSRIEGVGFGPAGMEVLPPVPRAARGPLRLRAGLTHVFDVMPPRTPHNPPRGRDRLTTWGGWTRGPPGGSIDGCPNPVLYPAWQRAPPGPERPAGTASEGAPWRRTRSSTRSPRSPGTTCPTSPSCSTGWSARAPAGRSPRCASSAGWPAPSRRRSGVAWRTSTRPSCAPTTA